MNKILNEDWGNIRALSPEVLKILSYHEKSRLGRNSKVLISREAPDEIFSKYANRSGDRALMIVLRYGQDDLFLMEPSWDELRVRGTNDWDTMTSGISWNERPNLQSTIKSASGMKSFVDKLCKFIVSDINKYDNNKPVTKKDIFAKINYQIIFSDKEREKTQSERTQNKNTAQVITKDGITTPSNRMMSKEGLKERLKQFIISKLPQYNNPEDLPKDMKLLNPNTRFKIMGCPYKYDDYLATRKDLNDLRNGKYMVYPFENEKKYDDEFKHYPKFILFTIKMDKDYKLYVSNIYFTNPEMQGYSPSDDDLIDISHFKEYMEKAKNE